MLAHAHGGWALMQGGVVAQVGFLGTVALMVFGGGCAMAHAFTALK